MAYSFDTHAVHAGQVLDDPCGAGAPPIHLSTSFVFEGFDQAAARFNLEQVGYIDSHLSNPTNAVLEERVAALEGGVGALALASGQAALHAAIITLMGADGHIVASRSLAGASRHLLEFTLPRLGITCTWVDPRDLAAWRAAIRPQTRLLLGEMLGSVGLEVLDVPEVATIAQEKALPLLVDNSAATPWLIRPLDLGGDLVFHSAGHFLGGHGAAIGGLLVDGGGFDWLASNGRFPTLTEPDHGLHGLNYSDESSVAAFLLRARLESLNDFGACMSPLNAFQLLQGLETLPLRLQRHIANTRNAMEFLAKSDAVEQIVHPELESHPDHALAQRLMPRGAGSMLHFSLRGGLSAARGFIEALRVFVHSTSVGGVRSSVIHPASTTLLGMDDAMLKTSDIGPGTVRLSIGLEDPADLIDDLQRGLSAAARR